MREKYDVVIIGGGQAGLAMGYQLASRGANFIILDAADRTGDPWRQRWDSLRLFTPASHSSLPGIPFPADPHHLPHKDEVADYLESYARLLGLPIRYRVKVTGLHHVSEWSGFTIETSTGSFAADQVVIATGPFQTPVIPAVSGALTKRITQLHSSEYRGPSQLPDGDVLVVGGGNSGVQIAAELAATRRTWLSVGEKLPTLPDRVMGRSIFWWLDTVGAMDVSVRSRMGRRASQRDFLIGKSAAATAGLHGVRLTGRVVGAEGSVFFTDDAAAIEQAAVIWATGFRQDFSWVDAPVLIGGRPVHTRGVTSVPGLYFLGLPWQHTRGSALLGWVGRDAAFLAQRIGA